MVEYKIPEFINSQLALDVLEQLRLCEDIESASDINQMKFFIWLETRLYQDKSIRKCLHSKDLKSLNEIIKFHINNLKEYIKCKKDPPQETKTSLNQTVIIKILEKLIACKTKISLETTLLDMKLESSILERIYNLSYDNTFRLSLFRDDISIIHKILEVNLCLIKNNNLPLPLLNELYKNILMVIERSNIDYCLPYILNFCEEYNIKYNNFYKWYTELEIDDTSSKSLFQTPSSDTKIRILNDILLEK